MDNVNKVTREFGMKINVKKTMCVSRKRNNKLKIYVDGQVEQVSQFRYLGSLIWVDGYCTKEIRSRIKMANKVFMEKKKLFTGKINMELKKRIIKCRCLVWSTALYVAETWTLTQRDRRRLEAFEIWIWRNDSGGK